MQSKRSISSEGGFKWKWHMSFKKVKRLNRIYEQIELEKVAPYEVVLRGSLPAVSRAGEMLKVTDLNPGVQMHGSNIVLPPQDSPTLEDLGITKMQNQAAEIKIRAERRAGEMLIQQIPHDGGRPIEKPSHDVTVIQPTLEDSPTLEDLGTTKMQNQAAEIKIRAERRAGEMLVETPLNKGASEEGWKTRSHDVTTLEDLGITKMQNQAAEIKIRAERRAGELLGDMERERPGEYKKLHDVTFQPNPGANIQVLMVNSLTTLVPGNDFSKTGTKTSLYNQNIGALKGESVA